MRRSWLRLGGDWGDTGGSVGWTIPLRTALRLPVDPELPANISSLGWAHILLTCEYRWPKRR